MGGNHGLPKAKQTIVGADENIVQGIISLTLSLANKLSSANFLTCFNFQIASMLLKAGGMLSECQTAWIRVRRRVTWRLIRIQAVCI